MNDDKRAKKLIDAIKRNDIPAVSSLISSGSVNLNGEPWPLHRAAELRGRVEIMTMLLDAGADINAVTKYRNTACHIAMLHDEFDALKLLVERGANLGPGVVPALLSTVASLDCGERYVILLLDDRWSVDVAT
jgi:ankyrin repeat protein